MPEAVSAILMVMKHNAQLGDGILPLKSLHIPRGTFTQLFDLYFISDLTSCYGKGHFDNNALDIETASKFQRNLYRGCFALFSTEGTSQAVVVNHTSNHTGIRITIVSLQSNSYFCVFKSSLGIETIYTLAT